MSQYQLSVRTGPTAQRPAASAIGKSPFWYDPFTNVLSFSDGVAWRNVAMQRDGYRMRTGAVGETMPRRNVESNLAVLTSGFIIMVAIDLAAATPIGHITFMSGSTAAVTPTNQWFALFDSSRNLLAVTADDTTTAWAANSEKTLAVATTAGGAAASFTTTYDGLHYLGIMVAAATVPTLMGKSGSSFVNALAPAVVGTSNNGQTTPQTFPFTANALVGINNRPWAWVAA